MVVVAAATVITAAPSHAAPPLGGGLAFSFGDNGAGQLGDNSTTQSLVPVEVTVTDPGPLAGKTITDVSASPTQTGGIYSACAVADGAAYCWGSNTSGQLGDNTNTNSTVPVAVDTSGVLNGLTVTQVSVGGNFACAIAYDFVVTDAKAYCWGDNSSGKLGNNNPDVNSSVPVAVDVSGVLSGLTVTDVSAGTSLACVVASGAAYCWGNNGTTTVGALGTGVSASTLASSPVPVAVSTSGVLSGKTVTDVAAGGGTSGAAHVCAVADDAAYCWGAGGAGRLGYNSTTGTTEPVAVYTAGVLTNVAIAAISVGGNFSCALSEVGVTYCWGNQGDGQLGNGTSSDNSLVPVATTIPSIAIGQPVTSLTLGQKSACQVVDAVAYCWGDNSSGQLGNGTTTDASVPTAVDTTGILGTAPVLKLGVGGKSAVGITSQAPVAPVTPTGSAPSGSTITVTWADPGSAVTGYQVQIATASASGPFTTISSGGCATATTSVSTPVSCVASGLTASTPYYFRVRAINASGSGQYSAASSAVSTLANQATLAISSGASKTYGTDLALTTSGGSGSGAVSYAVTTAGDGGCSISSAVLSSSGNAGTSCGVTATKASDSTYGQAVSAEQTVTVVKADQATLSISSSATKAFGTDLTLTATGGSSGGVVTYAVSSAGDAGCSITGDQLSTTGNVGTTCAVTATMAGNTNYNTVDST
ncbi:MAG TPA: hypothetical protein DCQ04_04100, partial [Actinobacteria bacterium]|nr:hypothetical protein [Actinomycetota bacterium]